MSQQLSRKQHYDALQSRQTTRMQQKKRVDKSAETAESSARSTSVGFMRLTEGDNLGLKTLTSCGETDLDSRGVGQQMGVASLAQEELESLHCRLKEAEREKSELEEQLRGQEYEVKKMLRQRQEELKALGDAGSSGALAKVVELSKRNRKITAELAAEKNQVRRMNSQIRSLEGEVASLSSQIKFRSYSDEGKSSCQPTDSTSDGKTVEGLTSECKKLEEKLARATCKLTEMRNQNQQCKRDLKMMQTVLAREVGDGVSVTDLLSTSSGWRGRSQQIHTLQKKLQQQLVCHNQSAEDDSSALKSGRESGTASADRDVGLSHVELKHRSLIRQLESDKKQTQQQLNADLESLQTEHTTLKNKFDALKARNKTVTAALKDSRQQVNLLLEKEKHDSQLIATLMAQQQDSNGRRHSTAQLERLCENKDGQIHQLKSLIEELERRLGEWQMTSLSTRGRDSSELSEWTGTRAIESRSAPSIGRQRIEEKKRLQLSQMKRPQTGHGLLTRGEESQLTGQAAMLLELKCRVQEQQTLCQVAEVERDRLLQLVSTLQRELADAKQSASAALQDLNTERRTTALLETKLDQKLMSIPLSAEPPAHLDNLQQRLSRQEEEIKALRYTVDEMRRDKETDMRLYDELHRQTKQIFLEGVRKVKANVKTN